MGGGIRSVEEYDILPPLCCNTKGLPPLCKAVVTHCAFAATATRARTAREGWARERESERERERQSERQTERQKERDRERERPREPRLASLLLEKGPSWDSQPNSFAKARTCRQVPKFFNSSRRIMTCSSEEDKEERKGGGGGGGSKQEAILGATAHRRHRSDDETRTPISPCHRREPLGLPRGEGARGEGARGRWPPL